MTMQIKEEACVAGINTELVLGGYAEQAAQVGAATVCQLAVPGANKKHWLVAKAHAGACRGRPIHASHAFEDQGANAPGACSGRPGAQA